MLDLTRKMFFVSHLDIILLLFLYIQCLWHVLVPVLFTCGSNETGKIVLLFSFVIFEFPLEGSAWQCM